MAGLARLKVDGPVLHLQQHIRIELSVERHELIVGQAGPILILMRRIDKRAPHHDAPVGREDRGQHIGAIGMRAAIVLRTWLTFRVGFDEKAAEVGDDSIDLIHFISPPCAHRLIEGVSAFQAADLDGRREARRQINL
jgi:hypothetical protein